MAVAPLNLTPELHSWHLAGLSCLLLDEAALERLQQGLRAVPLSKPLAAASTKPLAAASTRTLAGASTGPLASAQPAQANQPAQTGQPNPAERHVQPKQPVQPTWQAQQNQTAQLAGPAPQTQASSATLANQPSQPSQAGLAGPTSQQNPPALADWPQAWRELLERMQPAPLAWSYPELGEDLLLSGNKQRSAALREMISRLRLPRGSSTFWPSRLPGQNEGYLTNAPGGLANASGGAGAATAHASGGSDAAHAAGLPAAASASGASGALGASGGPDYFLAGLDLLKVRFLIVFGAEALRNTAYAALQPMPFSEQLAGGRLILALPGFESLLAAPGRLDKVVMFLEPILRRYLRP